MRLYILIKSRKMPVGTVSKGRKKIAEGKWRELPKGRGVHKYAVEVRNACKAIMEITKNKYEHAVAIASDGTEILSKGGKSSSVNFTQDERNRLRGARVVIHNHPGNRTFTPTDLMFALQLGITEMQVVTVDKLYSYRPDYGRVRESGLDLDEIDNDLCHCGSELYRPFWGQWGRGEISKDDADTLLCDALMEYFVATYGGKYVITRSKQ